MPDLDLDALIATELETKNEGPTLRFRGQEWRLPARLPFGLSVYLVAGRERDFARRLFGSDATSDDEVSEQTERFLSLSPAVSYDEVLTLLNYLPTAYAGKEEASAKSNGSSPSTGKRSRPTSAGSTEST